MEFPDRRRTRTRKRYDRA